MLFRSVTIQFHIVFDPVNMLHCVPTPPGMSITCFHLELGHNFLESFLATYCFSRFFFYKDSPRWRAYFLNSVFDCSPLRNSKNFQIFGCVSLFRKSEILRKLAPPPPPPPPPPPTLKVKKAAFNTELRRSFKV